MNKKTFATAFIASVLLFACSKKNDDVEAAKPEEVKTDTASLPHYDESNTKAYSWEELPSELKNATHISKAPVATGRTAETAYSYYRYATASWGGTGGSPFYIYPTSGSSIYAIGFGSGAFMDRLVVWYRSASGTIYYGGSTGGTGGTYRVYYLSSSERIQYIYGKTGALVDHLAFITNYKVFSGGGGGGTPFFYAVPSGYQALGFYGRSGVYLDRIGFYVYTN